MVNRVSKISPDQDLDQILDQFEARWREHGCAEIDDFLPPLESPDHAEVVCELVRVDLELRWRNNEQPQVEEYLERFANSNLNLSHIEELAFEEYRVRFQAGQEVTPSEYAHRFGFDASDWPIWTPAGKHKPTTIPTDANGHVWDPGRRKSQSKITLPEIGDKFHGFELVGLLGRGAFGRVFLARQEDLANRFVALKVTEVSDIEPQCLARLQHTNIIPIYSLKQAEKLQSICMPFLGVATMRDLFFQAEQKESLSQSGQELISTVAGRRASTIVATVSDPGVTELGAILNRGNAHGGSVPAIEGLSYQQTALWMVGRVADGLAYAHSRDIVHGDLKPGNILISDDGEPVILDFHMSRAGNEVSSDSLVGGTVPYMSPRHLQSLRGENDVDTSCDLFSLGVVLYESLTGVLPYSCEGIDDDSIDQMIRDRRRRPVSVRKHNPDLSSDVDSIVERCLCPTPGRQYTSARELQTDIERHLLNLPLRYAPNRSLAERCKKWVKRHPRLTSATSVATLALIAIGIAGALIAGRLFHAAKVEAENRSNRFLESVAEVQLPLTMKNGIPADFQMPVETASGVLQFRTDGGPQNYLDELAVLPAGMRNRELREVGFTKYWIAYRRLDMANSISNQTEKDRQLEQAIDDLDFVIATTGVQTPVAVLQLKADVLEVQGLFDQAQQLRGKTPAAQGVGTIKDRLCEAAELFRNRDDYQAIEVLQKLTGEQPDVYPAWMMMGRVYSRLREYDKAEVCFSTVIEMSPDVSWGYTHRGINHLLQRNYESAKRDFDSAIERDSNNANAYLNRALALRGMRKLNSAIYDLTTAIEQGATETRAYYLRHQIRKQQGNTAESDQDLAKFLDLEPQDEVSWLSRGMAQIKIEKPEMALADFKMALRLNPESVNAFQNIATVEAEFLDETDNAIEALSQIMNLEPDNLVAHVTRGVLSARLGHREQALADANLVLEQNSSADMLFRAAGIFALTSKTEEEDAQVAIKLLNQASFKDPRLVLGRLAHDPDLNPLHEREDYNELVRRLQGLAQNARPK